MNQLSEREQYILARWSYSVGEPVISDAEYTRLHHYISVTSPKDPYVLRTWSEDPCPKELLERIGRSDLIRNVTLTDATESIPSVGTWVELKSLFEFYNGYATLSMKHDGWNIQFNYYNGELLDIHTRGRKGGNLKVQRLSTMVPQTIPYSGRVKIVQELTVPLYLWGEVRKLYKSANPRNAVHTLLAKSETNQYLQLHAVDIHGVDLGNKNKFEVLKDIGFEVPLYKIVSNYSEMQYAMKELSANKATYVAETDGLVFDGFIKKAIRLLAWEEPIYQSYVTGYPEKYSKHRINPSIAVYPVLCGGRIQRQINMTNIGRIIKNNLRLGSPIAFRNASDAIADIDEGVTALLQKEWEGRWDAYAQSVREAQEIKQMQLDHLGVYTD